MSTPAADGTLWKDRAGWSEIDITPPLGIFLGGRAMVLTEAASIKAPLLGQVLVLEDSRGSRLVLLSLDLISLSDALSLNLQIRIGSVTGVLPEAVIINCSHTHSGPMTHYDKHGTFLSKPPLLAEYETWLIEQLANAAGEALQRLKAAAVTHRVGSCYAGINRRRVGPDGRIVMGPNAEGSMLPDLLLLEIIQQETQARCLAYSYACHPIIDCGWNRALLSPHHE